MTLNSNRCCAVWMIPRSESSPRPNCGDHSSVRRGRLLRGMGTRFGYHSRPRDRRVAVRTPARSGERLIGCARRHAGWFRRSPRSSARRWVAAREWRLAPSSRAFPTALHAERGPCPSALPAAVRDPSRSARCQRTLDGRHRSAIRRRPSAPGAWSVSPHAREVAVRSAAPRIARLWSTWATPVRRSRGCPPPASGSPPMRACGSARAGRRRVRRRH
jgi:hypothetical protein